MRLFSHFKLTGRVAGMMLVLALGHAAFAAGKETSAKNPPPTTAPEPKQAVAPQIGVSPTGASPAGASPAGASQTVSTPEANTVFQELNFNKTLIIEGKVEKPQVQFTLLKEPPPEKQIHFETSFLQNILKLDRENTFKVGESYGRD